MSTPFWIRAGGWFNSRSIKERSLVFAVGFAAIAGSLYVVKFLPLLDKQKALSSEISTKETEVNVLMGQIAELSKGSRDPDKDLKTRRDELKRLISEAEVGLKKKRERTVAPDRIAQLLEDVLSRQGRLELVELRSLPPEPLFNEDSIVTKNADKSDRKDAPKGERDSDSKPKGDVIQGIYRHGVQLTVKGEYMELLGYLTSLERLPIQLFWKDMDVQIAEYPDATMRVTLFTVSFNRVWLSV